MYMNYEYTYKMLQRSFFLLLNFSHWPFKSFHFILFQINSIFIFHVFPQPKVTCIFLNFFSHTFPISSYPTFVSLLLYLFLLLCLKRSTAEAEVHCSLQYIRSRIKCWPHKSDQPQTYLLTVLTLLDPLILP